MMVRKVLLLLLCTTSLLQYSLAWTSRPMNDLWELRSPPSTRLPSGHRRLSSMSSSNLPYPRAAVSVAIRCEYEAEVYYLLVQRGKDPNKGRWSFPGGKMEIGETALEGGKRELLEETQFVGQDTLQWYPETIATHDSLSVTKNGIVDYHFLIAVCFAELKHVPALPNVTATDDAANAKWWRIKDLMEQRIDVTPGLIERINRTEFLYQREALL